MLPRRLGDNDVGIKSSKLNRDDVPHEWFASTTFIIFLFKKEKEKNKNLQSH